MEQLETRCLPASTITAAFGAGVGGGPAVTVLFDDGSRTTFLAFNPAFTGGISVATGAVNGTGIPDVIVGVARGGVSEVKVYDGAKLVAGQVVATADFLAFPSSFVGGVTLAVGHINGTTHDDVVVAAGPGGGTRVKVFDGADLAQGKATATANFTALDAKFRGHVIVATGAVNGTGHDDVVVAAGPGGGPIVKVFDGAGLMQGEAVATAEIMAFAPAFTGGVTLAVGPVNGTTHADVVVAPGPSGISDIKVYDGASLAKSEAVATANFLAFDPAFTGGVSLAVGNFNGTKYADVAVGAGPGGGPIVNVFDGAHLAQGQAMATASYFAYPPTFTGGIQVITANLSQTGSENLIVVAAPGGGPQVILLNSQQLVSNNFGSAFNFMAFPPAFVGGFGFGYGPYYGPGGYFGHGDIMGGSAGSSTSGSKSDSASGSSNGTMSGTAGPAGVSLRAAGGSLGLGSNAQGGGLYLAPGQLSLASLSAGNSESGDPGTPPPVGSTGALATPAQLRSAIEEAISWWDQAGIDPAQDQQLRTVQFQIVNLGGVTLGRTTDGIIHLSPDAAGYGWFIDTPATLQNGFGTATPKGLVAGPNSPAVGHMDLATTIAHEMGLVLGLKETKTPGDIMGPFLAPGMRRLPTAQDLDVAFSQSAPFG